MANVSSTKVITYLIMSQNFEGYGKSILSTFRTTTIVLPDKGSEFYIDPSQDSVIFV